MNKLRSEILSAADKLINEDKAKEHGKASITMRRVARLWEAYLDLPEGTITPADACAMMSLLKKARFRMKKSRDNIIDDCGYTALQGELEERS
ncbi:hypothetical protein GWO43_16100 [candidate division KSB1 bacterium]|nr:hypothetical protein [candidate division KSB1 bacterium]NIV68756.1 hypothetical protein [Phycisphaerae bacterium]NIS25473.1 hypothetical protein [candidate division KSB1 bacterium]NIT72366.1 hypothetical protein [candidate division KSB1 bacterium]NIU26150.1 hypothetical protein [candidate division KSB1 bacterium]